MNRFAKLLPVVLYEDVLCPRSYLAESRLSALMDEFRHQVRWKTRPYPMRTHEAQPAPRELAGRAKEISAAQREPDGMRLRTDLWTQGDPPASSLTAMAALEAARLQGPHAHHLLSRAMRRAALEQGVNVSRPDVAFELAARVGLEMNRFSAAFQSPETKRLILEERRLAESRGVRMVPSLVIGSRWLVSGLREAAEYREHLLACLGKSGGWGFGADQGVVH